MTREKKSLENATTVGAARSPAKGNRPLAVAPVPNSCEAVLASVIRLAQAASPAALLPANGEATAPSAVEAPAPVPTVAAPTTAQQALSQAMQELAPEMALKLRTLMVAGREGSVIGSTPVNDTSKRQAAAPPAPPSTDSENSPGFADYLRRGHAMACAAAVDIELPVAGWGAAGPLSLDERAWISFGKQLATSQPDEWKCLAFVQPGARQISKLYLKLGEHAWWSFQAVLDRPSSAAVDKQKRELTSRRSKGVATTSLKALMSQLVGTEGRALRRAARAIRARVGETAEA